MTQLSRRTIAFLFAVLPVFAVRRSLPAQATPVAISAARMLDVRSGRTITPGLVVVQGGKITQVGGAAPSGAEAINLGDATLMPGFIDAHTHLTFEIAPGFDLMPVKETVADEAIRGVANAAKTLNAGFTTVRNVGSGGMSDVALMHAIEQGTVPGPRIIPAGYSIGITGGHCDVTGFAPGIAESGPAQGVANGPDQMIEAVRQQIKYGAQVIKICATAGVLSFENSVGAQQMSDAELKAVVDEANRHDERARHLAGADSGLGVADQHGSAAPTVAAQGGRGASDGRGVSPQGDSGRGEDCAWHRRPTSRHRRPWRDCGRNARGSRGRPRQPTPGYHRHRATGVRDERWRAGAVIRSHSPQA
ncbi:MAG: amidohydrolase family protein [Gemmatimonadales bacterium]